MVTEETKLPKPDQLIRELYYNPDGTPIPIRIKPPAGHVDMDQLVKDFSDEHPPPDFNKSWQKDSTPPLEDWLNGTPIISEGRAIFAKPMKQAIKGYKEPSPYEIARKLRVGFWNGMMTLCERQNKTLDQVMADWLEKDPHGTFKMVSPFFPKQIEATVRTDLVSFLKDIERKRRNSAVIDGAIEQEETDDEG